MRIFLRPSLTFALGLLAGMTIYGFAANLLPGSQVKMFSRLVPGPRQFEVFSQPVTEANQLDRVKFEVDYIKHICTMCAAAVAFIAGYLKLLEKEAPFKVASTAIACFVLTATGSTIAYGMKNYGVSFQDKPRWHVPVDMALAVITTVTFVSGVLLLLFMCIGPLFRGKTSGPSPVGNGASDGVSPEQGGGTGNPSQRIQPDSAESGGLVPPLKEDVKSAESQETPTTDATTIMLDKKQDEQPVENLNSEIDSVRP